jgi:nucleotide-binding universal stress UspA family protein
MNAQQENLIHNLVSMKSILFATDFSPISTRALPYAAAFARRFGAALCVVHVVGSAEAGRDHKNDGRASARLQQQAEAHIRQVLGSSPFRDLRYEVLLTEGDVLPALASVVETRGADLMVLGMHGRHGLEKVLLGSVADEILRLAEIPVLVAGPQVVMQPEQEFRMHGVLYAADFSPGCGRALQYAGAIASAEQARLLVLHVVEDVWSEPASTRLGGEEYLRLKLLEKGWMASVDPLEPELLVEFGPVEERILSTAVQHGVELVVLDVPSTKHPLLSAHLPGPMAYNVASHAPCPVLAVRGVT